MYVIYVFLLHHSYKASLKNNQDSEVRETEEDDGEEEELEISSEGQAWGWIIGMMLLMGGASHVLVEAAIHLGDLAGIDAVIMGFVVIAAGTSVPDTVLSVISAKKGQ